MNTSVPPVFGVEWEGFAFMKQGQRLSYLPYRGYETRNESTFRMIELALRRHAVPDFDWVVVYTGDFLDAASAGAPFKPGRVTDRTGREWRLLSYCTAADPIVHVCPDFVYDHWKQTGLDDYEETRNAVSAMTTPSTMDVLGWRGAATHTSRERLVELDDKIDFDCEYVRWDRTNPDRLVATNFLSLAEQVARWRYLMDMEGRGYSGRLKVLLCTPRLVFVQARRWQEDFFTQLQPWVHYVPVSNDLTDLREAMARVKADPDLERSIIGNARRFAVEHLTRDAALSRWAGLLREPAGVTGAGS